MGVQNLDSLHLLGDDEPAWRGRGIHSGFNDLEIFIGDEFFKLKDSQKFDIGGKPQLFHDVYENTQELALLCQTDRF